MGFCQKTVCVHADINFRFIKHLHVLLLTGDLWVLWDQTMVWYPGCLMPVWDQMAEECLTWTVNPMGTEDLRVVWELKVTGALVETEDLRVMGALVETVDPRVVRALVETVAVLGRRGFQERGRLQCC